MTITPQTEPEPTTADRARDYLAKAAPVNQLPPSKLMIDLQLARTYIELLLREPGGEA